MHCLNPPPPDDETLSRFSRGELDQPSRQRLEGHLSRCEACRRRLVRAHRARRPAPDAGATAIPVPQELRRRIRAMGRQPRRSRYRWDAFAAAAAIPAVAALVLIVLWRFQTPPTATSIPLQPGDPWTLRSEDIPSPWRDLMPTNGARLEGPDIELSWHLVLQQRSQQIFILDELGNVRYQGEVEGDRLILSADDLSPPPRGATQLYWTLSLDLPDGQILESQVSGFVWHP